MGRSDLGDLEPIHFHALRDWAKKFDEKYDVLGRIEEPDILQNPKYNGGGSYEAFFEFVHEQ